MEQARSIFQSNPVSEKQSHSPFGESFDIPTDLAQESTRLQQAFGVDRPIVAVQGLGFVGAAMSAALMQSKDASGSLRYNVIGVDLLHADHYWKIARSNIGLPPVSSADASIDDIYAMAQSQGNFTATYSETAYTMADIIIVDVNVDVHREAPGDINKYEVSLDGLKAAIQTLARHMKPDALVLVETTLPPGTTEKIIAPILRDELKGRKLYAGDFNLAYSFERVMPGESYLNSIIAFHRAFAGINPSSSLKTRDFLESFIDTQKFPLHELGSTTACEMAKVLENSYRATNIAFIEEWSGFAQKAGVDLFEIVNSIRVRPTHSNIMAPGFGVGGYCLTKDALLGEWGLKTLFNTPDNLEFSRSAISVNDRMPAAVMDIIRNIYTDLTDIQMAILGISYRPDVADTRNTPADHFNNLCLAAGMQVSYHDPLLSYWSERDLPISNDLGDLYDKSIELLVFALPSQDYRKLTGETIVAKFPELKVVIDANNVLTDSTAESLHQAGIQVAGIGKGHWNRFWRKADV